MWFGQGDTFYRAPVDERSCLSRATCVLDQYTRQKLYSNSPNSDYKGTRLSYAPAVIDHLLLSIYYADERD